VSGHEVEKMVNGGVGGEGKNTLAIVISSASSLTPPPLPHSLPQPSTSQAYNYNPRWQH